MKKVLVFLMVATSLSCTKKTTLEENSPSPPTSPVAIQKLEASEKSCFENCDEFRKACNKLQKSEKACGNDSTGSGWS